MAAHVSMSFAKLPDGELVPFAVGVHDGLAGNPTLFPNPPVPLDVLSAATTAFEQALIAAHQGSVAQTEAKNNRRRELIALLRELAVFVEHKAKGDVQVILSSGFLFSRRGYSPQVQLIKPANLQVRNGKSGELVASVAPVPTAKSYMAEIRIGDGPWQSAGTFTQARRMVLKDLVPGTLYWVRVRAVGGSTGYSEWSDAIQHMCM